MHADPHGWKQLVEVRWKLLRRGCNYTEFVRAWSAAIANIARAAHTRCAKRNSFWLTDSANA
jgi:hypothetical protein